jgi:hypothetical protein
MASSLLNTTLVRADQRRGQNLRLYVAKTDFERIPYPDREPIIGYISEPSCEQANNLFLPSVYFYDIRSGDELTSHNCYWNRRGRPGSSAPQAPQTSSDKKVFRYDAQGNLIE